MVQAIHASLPALLELREQAGRTTDRIGPAGDTLGAAVPALGHKSRTLQHGDVFLHGGKRHVVMRREFAHGRLGVHDSRQDVAPRRVGERPEQRVQGVGGWLPIYNHMVVDSITVVSSVPRQVQ